MKPCILIDLDGTLADLGHRLHFIKNGNRDWDSFFATVKDDAPIPEICELNEMLQKHGEYIIICSGRSSVCMQDTLDWLEEHDVYYDRLLMREEGDYRPDYTIKEEMLLSLKEEGFDPWLAIDDRQRIAQVWRKHGIMTLQCDDWEENERPKRLREPVLHVLIGGTGAGKTTFAESRWNRDMIVSSDRIREEVLGDMKDQTKNDAVFSIFHSLVKHRLSLGLDTVADATNIRRKDRRAVAALNDGPVVYHVIDRPVEEKITDWRWRELVEKHTNTFNNNLKWILDGDGLDNVTVEDHRD